MDTMDTLIADLKADAKAETLERQRRAWQDTGAVAALHYVPLAADLQEDSQLLAEVWDNEPEMFGAPAASDYKGNGWKPVPGGRKREVLPFA